MRITGAGYGAYADKIYSENKKPSEKSEDRKSLLGKDSGDRIELSKESRDIKGYASQNVNTERIESIKNLIAKGEYRVSSEELASAIIKRMAE